MTRQMKSYFIIVISCTFFLLFPLSIISFGWTLKADFEQGLVGDIAKGPSGFIDAGTQTWFSNENAFSGSQSAKMKYNIGDTGFGTCRGTFPYPHKLSEGDEIWGRGYFYFKPPVDWWCKPRIKIFRLSAIRSNSGDWRGYISIIADYNGMIRLSNEIAGERNDQTGVYLDVGKWMCLEIYIKLSVSDPIVRIWKDGKLIAERREEKTLKSETDKAFLSYIMSSWNGGPKTKQVVFLDDFVITTETPSQRDDKGNPMIGPLPSPPPESKPQPPINLRIID